jgi:two-component system nitrate/nitrite response regulator NarL
MSDAEKDVRDALRFGADGYLLKDMKQEKPIQQVREALQGELVISPGLTRVLAKYCASRKRQLKSN